MNQHSSCPPVTPDSVLRTVEQAILGHLERQPSAEEIPVPRRTLVHWQRLLESAHIATEAPAPLLLIGFLAACGGALVTLVACVLWH